MAQEVGQIKSALVGGACGALIADRLVRAGMRRERAALAVAVGGGLAGMALRGKARSAAIGASAACAGQLALMWLEARAQAASASDSPETTDRTTPNSAATISAGEDAIAFNAPVIDEPESATVEPAASTETWSPPTSGSDNEMHESSFAGEGVIPEPRSVAPVGP